MGEINQQPSMSFEQRTLYRRFAWVADERFNAIRSIPGHDSFRIAETTTHVAYRDSCPFSSRPSGGADDAVNARHGNLACP